MIVKVFLTPTEIAAAKKTARQIVTNQPFHVCWAIAAELGMADELGGAEYKRQAKEVERRFAKAKNQFDLHPPEEY